MNYHIHITQTAERDMISAADYIEFTLKNPFVIIIPNRYSSPKMGKVILQS